MTLHVRFAYLSLYLCAQFRSCTLAVFAVRLLTPKKKKKIMMMTSMTKKRPVPSLYTKCRDNGVATSRQFPFICLNDTVKRRT